MKKSEYKNLSSKEIKQLIKKKKKEINILENYCFDLEQKEYDEKYVLVQVDGCKGCELEHTEYNNTCDHCEGYHHEYRLRNRERSIYG